MPKAVIVTHMLTLSTTHMHKPMYNQARMAMSTATTATTSTRTDAHAHGAASA